MEVNIRIVANDEVECGRKLCLFICGGCSTIFPKTIIKVKVVDFRRRNGTFEREELNLYAANISTIYSKHVGERPYKFILYALTTK